MNIRFGLILTTLVGLGGPLTAEPDYGAYLAGRLAAAERDYGTASSFFADAVRADPSNPGLVDSTILSGLAAGQPETVLDLARSVVASGRDSQVADMVLLAEAARNGDWAAIFDLYEANRQVGPLVDGLAQAWAFVGLGRMDRALDSFDEVAETPGLRSFGLLHKAFALSMVGDLEGADALLGAPGETGIIPSRGSVLTHVNVLARLGRMEEAASLLSNAFPGATDPELDAIRAALEAGDIPQSAVVSDAKGGIGYTFLTLAEILRGDTDETYLLLYAQAAAHIQPDDAGAHMAAARLLDAIGQYDLAAQSYARVATDDPEFYLAELGRASSLQSAGKAEAAIEVLTQLTRSHPEVPLVHASLGDAFRRVEDYGNANAAYDTALSLYPEGDESLWWVTYVRGITFERLGQWPEAEADFRRALELNPGHPSVLNYLGYSMVDMGINLEESLELIEEAVAAQPDNGAIVDSLGWAYFKLGRYEEAVAPLERAAELEPVDPIITDHLGDSYAMVGRMIEARFQWRRALSFDPEPELAERIRLKLEIGLEAVMAQEAEDAAEMAQDGN